MTTDPLAQAVMVAYCGWDPTEVVIDRTVTLDGNGTRLLTLPSLYVTGVSAVTVTDQYGTVHTYLSTDSPATIGPGNTMVGWSENGVLIYGDPALCGVWPEDLQNVTVTYSGGYASIPPDLDAALTHLTARMPSISGAVKKQLGSASITYASQSGGRQGASTVAEGGLLLVEQLVFDRYRIIRAA